MISLLVAHDENRVIGADNAMPWHIPEELKYFKEKTMGKGIIMGRRTFESIGRPLKGRLNLILTRNAGYHAEGAVAVQTLDEAIVRAENYADEVMIIGGAEIFEMAMPIADRLYVTVIRHSYEGDTYFPEYSTGWKLISESDAHRTEDGIEYVYCIYERETAA
ncbi:MULTISPECIES: dihydrofolate reductase [Sporosarcina]|uniref:dihydrofolate reductase n=1 Tax=Sporosarcina TaxID=1569 RepID=UPI00058E8CC4|nr:MULTISPECIES: dihydrofolate reductase [Sporosarcina]WJY28230.1 dihydrofolate reductase [Sporosarcina sp. 0.2-SM1T-5]